MKKGRAAQSQDRNQKPNTYKQAAVIFYSSFICLFFLSKMQVYMTFSSKLESRQYKSIYSIPAGVFLPPFPPSSALNQSSDFKQTGVIIVIIIVVVIIIIAITIEKKVSSSPYAHAHARRYTTYTRFSCSGSSSMPHLTAAWRVIREARFLLACKEDSCSISRILELLLEHRPRGASPYP